LELKGKESFFGLPMRSIVIPEVLFGLPMLRIVIPEVLFDQSLLD
jgi:hypothetical protein